MDAAVHVAGRALVVVENGVDDRAGLRTRAAMAHIDGHVIAGLGFPLLGESRVDILVKLARRVVAHIEQGDLGAFGGTRDREETCHDCDSERFHP